MFFSGKSFFAGLHNVKQAQDPVDIQNTVGNSINKDAIGVSDNAVNVHKSLLEQNALKKLHDIMISKNIKKLATEITAEELLLIDGADLCNTFMILIEASTKHDFGLFFATIHFIIF